MGYIGANRGHMGGLRTCVYGVGLRRSKRRHIGGSPCQTTKKGSDLGVRRGFEAKFLPLDLEKPHALRALHRLRRVERRAHRGAGLGGDVGCMGRGGGGRGVMYDIWCVRVNENTAGLGYATIGRGAWMSGKTRTW